MRACDAGSGSVREFTGLELRGRTLGIIGLGKIGQAIADRARAMEMVVLGADPYVTPEQAGNHGVELMDLAMLLARADVITVHVPLTRATRNLIGKAEIGQMRPGSIIINVARGGIVDEAAVADALASGQLAGAGFDVFEHEPPTDSPLLAAPNTLLTPHLGASTAEAQVLVAEEVAAQVLDVLEGRSARYAVNAPLLTPETAKAIAPYLPLGGDPRPLLRPVLARWRAHADPRDRRARSPSTTGRRSPPRCCAGCSRPSRRSASTSSTPARSRRRAASRSSSARPATPARTPPS